MPLVLGGVVAGVAACALAVYVILGGVGVGGESEAGQVVGSGATDGRTLAQTERQLVPDACELLPQDVADALAPGADRTQGDTYQGNGQQNQCVWGAYAGDTKRQLTVELRAILADGGKSPTKVAQGQFATEKAADESGKALLPGQRLTEKTVLEGVGDEGYIVYSVDDGQGSGEAIANVRVGNVLVTIHYSGGDHSGDDSTPLSSSTAMDGASQAAKAVVTALGST